MRLQRALIAALAAYAVAVILPDTLRVFPAVEGIPVLAAWYPLATLGFQADNDGVVTAVDRDSDAWAQCLRPGDVVDLRAPTTERRAVNQFVFVSHGRTHTVHLARRGTGDAACRDALPGDVHLRPIPEQGSFAQHMTLLAAQVSGFLFIALCTVLVWHHPSAETWGLFLYAVWFNSGQYFVWYANLPHTWLAPFDALQALFQALGLTGILAFALYFPRDAVDGWRRWAVPALAVPAALLLGFGLWAFGNFFVGARTERAYDVYYALTWVVYAAMFALFAHTYATQAAERPRIRWVILGAAWALLCFLVADTYEATALFQRLHLGVTIPETALNLLYAQTVCLPAAIFYAVRRHRVINVRFAITRTVVLAVFLTGLVAVLKFGEFVIDKALVTKWDWLERLDGGLVVSLGLVGAWTDTRAHRLVERLLFRAWHRTEIRLREVADDVADGEDWTRAEVDHVLVDDLVAALDLTCGALFRRTENGRFELARSVGWPDTAVPALEADDPLVGRLGHLPLSLGSTSDGPRALDFIALAVPVVVHRALAAVLLLGAHATGEDLDHDEIAVIRDLTRGASIAYTRLEAEALRSEVETLRDRLAVTRGDGPPAAV